MNKLIKKGIIIFIILLFVTLMTVLSVCMYNKLKNVDTKDGSAGNWSDKQLSEAKSSFPDEKELPSDIKNCVINIYSSEHSYNEYKNKDSDALDAAGLKCFGKKGEWHPFFTDMIVSGLLSDSKSDKYAKCMVDSMEKLYSPSDFLMLSKEINKINLSELTVGNYSQQPSSILEYIQNISSINEGCVKLN